MLDASLRLTEATVRKINWRRIDESSIGMGTRSAHNAQAPAATSPERLQAVFSTAQKVFNEAIADLERMTRTLSWIVGGTTALIVVATLVGQFVVNARAGMFSLIFSLGGVAGLLAITFRLINAHRDIVILKLVPTKYALAFRLAQTDDQRADLFHNFMSDLASLHAGDKLANG
jgi:hypothetical protein